jgi:excisionase family DNA binding protein
MSATKTKSANVAPNGSFPGTPSVSLDDASDVFNLSEAATFLRVAEEDILRLLKLRELPGRQIGNEWRFLKSGLQDWLRMPERKSGKEAMLAMAGVWKGDPDIEEIVREAHKRRVRGAI